MEALTAILGSRDNLVWTLITLLVFSVLTNLYFIQNNQLKKLSKRAINSITPDIVKAFIDEQYRKTTLAKKNNELNFLAAEVIKLRSAYLKIESKSLNYTISSKEYWNTLNEQLKKLYEILTRYKTSKSLSSIFEKIELIRNEVSKSNSKPKNKEAVFRVLQDFRVSCIEHSDNPEKLAQYNKTIDELFKKLGNAKYSQLSKNAGAHKRYTERASQSINEIKKHVEEISTDNENSEVSYSAQKYNHTNSKIKEGLNQYENDIGEINSAVNHATRATIVHVDNDAEISRSMDNLDEISEQIQRENDREIGRLKGLVKNQRNTIAELELALDDQDASAQPSQIDIDQLKRSLLEAEQCVEILENELDKLRSSAHTLPNRDTFTQEHATLDDDNIGILKDTISKLEEEVSSVKEGEKEKGTLIEFYREGFSAQTPEDASLLLFQTLSELGVMPRLIVFNQNRDIEVVTGKKISDREKMLVKCMEINEINHDHRQNTISFRFLNFGGWLSYTEGSLEKDRERCVIDVLQNADKVISHIKSLQSNRAHKSRLDQCANDTKRIAREVDESLEHHLKKTKSTLRDAFSQISDVSRARGMPASQIAGIKEMEKEALIMLESDETIRLKTKQKLLKLLRSIEE